MNVCENNTLFSFCASLFLTQKVFPFPYEYFSHFPLFIFYLLNVLLFYSTPISSNNNVSIAMKKPLAAKLYSQIAPMGRG